MDARHAAFDQLTHLLDRKFDADLELPVVVILLFGQATHELGRKLSSAERSDALNLSEVGDRQQARHDGYLNPNRIASVAETEEIVVAVEKLCNDHVRAAVDFSLQVFQIHFMLGAS